MRLSALSLLALVSCARDADTNLPVGDDFVDTPLLGVTETETWALPGLTHEAYVVRTEGSIPYLYARNRSDLARVQGFVLARDRFFSMDLIRRLSQGRVSELLGDAGLASDVESRGIGMTHVVDQILASMDDDPELAAVSDGFADGVNAYIDAVAAGDLPPPSELALLSPFLGALDPVDLMGRWERRDVAGVGATLVYNLGFETGDVGRTEDHAYLPQTYDPAAALYDLRQAGVVEDVWDRVEPVFPVSSAPGWGIADGGRARSASGSNPPKTDRRVPPEMIGRLRERLERLEARMGHDHEGGFGSNAWAVAGYASADGRSYLAGDGHLPLTVPSLFYAAGLDTAHLGGAGFSQVGLLLPGDPILAVGTNGHVAWSQTQLFGDITDWYREEIQLGSNGEPSASLFQGAWQPLVRHEETYEIAEVVLLDSVGRTETWARWTTFDGRWITEIEGDVVELGTAPGAGEALVNVSGTLVIPRDLDGDGVITAISFDYTGLDTSTLFGASDAFGHAESVDAFHEATKRLVAYSQNLIVSDAEGSVMYTGYQAVPCRSYLPRNADGSWMEGADPTMLLDGTTYGGFTIPVVGGFVDESLAADPYRCVVPHAEYPTSIDPPEGYVLTANNDIGNISTDGSMFDDPWYIGGPWLEGYRGKRIEELLAASVAEGWADEEGMARIQGDHLSNVGEQLLPVYLEAVALARAAAADGAAPDTSEHRVAQLYLADQERIDEATERLEAWQASGLLARSGVETFYQAVEPGDVESAVATTIFNAWVGRYLATALDDEGWRGVYRPTGDTGRTRTITRMLAGRGPDNPEGMASWNPVTGESAFFDILATPEVETSHEVAMLAMVEALDFLATPPDDSFQGGYGTDDMDAWLWGLRHVVKFESILSELFSADDELGFLIDTFSVNTDVLPVAGDLQPGDPRQELTWFPRNGDQLAVDACNGGFDGGVDASYGSGPVFRMVIGLGGEGPTGRNILPGGQSGLTDSPNFADQAALWVGNETLPMHMTIDAVIAAGTGRETFVPR